MVVIFAFFNLWYYFISSDYVNLILRSVFFFSASLYYGQLSSLPILRVVWNSVNDLELSENCTSSYILLSPFGLLFVYFSLSHSKISYQLDFLYLSGSRTRLLLYQFLSLLYKILYQYDYITSEYNVIWFFLVSPFWFVWLKVRARVQLI